MNAIRDDSVVGAIPTDWTVVTLGSVATFKTGPFGSALHKSDYVDVGVPVINPTQIVNGALRPTRSISITKEAATRLAEFRLSPGDVIIGRRGEMGRCAFVPVGANGWLCGTGSMVVRTGDLVDARFLQRVLSSRPVVAAIESASVGSTMININQTTLGSLRIALPPGIAEQKAIAQVLDHADALIESLEQLIAKKQLVKQGAMQKLLTGCRRLPGFNEDWRVARLGDLGRCLRGVSYKPEIDLSPTDTNSTVRLLRANNVQGSRITIDDLQFVVQTRVKPQQFLRQNDVLICMANGSRDLVGKAGAFHLSDDQRYTFGAFMGCFRPDQSCVDPIFAFFLFHTQRYRSQIGVLLAGSSINNLTPNAIAGVISDMDAEIAALEERLVKIRLVEQGMMQQLLTGTIRLV